MIFISYSFADKQLATDLCNFLETRGVPCWIAPRNIQVGKNYARAIVEGLQAASGIIVILSKRANESRHVQNEVERAFHRNIPIMPFRVEAFELSAALTYFLSATHRLDATGCKPQKLFEELYINCSQYCAAGVPVDNSLQKIPRSKNKGRNKKLVTLAAVTVFCLLLLPAYYFFGNNSKQIGAALSVVRTDTIPAAENVVFPLADSVTKAETIHNKNSEPVNPSPVVHNSDKAGKLIKVLDNAVYIDGPSESQVISEDKLTLRSLRGNLFSFEGKSGIYNISGKMKLYGTHLTVIDGNITGNLNLYDSCTLLKGSIEIIASESVHTINLQKNQ